MPLSEDMPCCVAILQHRCKHKSFHALACHNCVGTNHLCEPSDQHCVLIGSVRAGCEDCTSKEGLDKVASWAEIWDNHVDSEHEDTVALSPKNQVANREFLKSLEQQMSLQSKFRVQKIEELHEIHGFIAKLGSAVVKTMYETEKEAKRSAEVQVRKLASDKPNLLYLTKYGNADFWHLIDIQKPHAFGPVTIGLRSMMSVERGEANGTTRALRALPPVPAFDAPTKAEAPASPASDGVEDTPGGEMSTVPNNEAIGTAEQLPKGARDGVKDSSGGEMSTVPNNEANGTAQDLPIGTRDGVEDSSGSEMSTVPNNEAIGTVQPLTIRTKAAAGQGCAGRPGCSGCPRCLKYAAKGRLYRPISPSGHY